MRRDLDLARRLAGAEARTMLTTMPSFRLSQLSAFALLATTISLGSAACGDDETTPAKNPELRFATYNAGLAYGFVEYAEQRSALIPPAVAELPVDVLCLQEVWNASDVAAMKSATASKLPSAFFFENSQDFAVGAACEAADVAPLIACVEANCGTVPEANCVLTECAAEFSAQTPECTTCLGANVGGSIEAIEAACGEGSALYAYDGAFGVGLLTNQTVTASDRLVLDSTLNRRGVLYAELETDAGPVHVFCTHLSAALSINYPGPAGSWEAEQRAQIDTMLAYVAEKAGTEPAVILGDLNTGPALDGIAGELPANFDVFVDAGWNVPFLNDGASCTFCGDNPLVGNPGDPKNTVLIDHVMFKNQGSGAFSSERVLDEDVTINVEGADQTTKLSDHYGLSVTWSTNPGDD
jgi:endonuclease/exonuclease/phosphatase family metal-dependent hydrolase